MIKHFSLLSFSLLILAIVDIALLIYTQFDSITFNNNILLAKSPNIFSNGFDQLMILIWGIIFLIVNTSHKHLELNNVVTKVVRASSIERARVPE